MTKSNSMLIGIFIAVVLGAIIIYLNQNDQQPVREGFEIDPLMRMNPNNPKYMAGANIMPIEAQTVANRPLRQPILNNRTADQISGDLVSDIVNQYTNGGNLGLQSDNIVTGSDPLSDTHGSFANYGHKQQINMKKMEQPYSRTPYDNLDSSYGQARGREQRWDDSESSASASESSARDFNYRKRKYTKRTPADIKDQFNIDKMLPMEIENDWFDTQPLQGTKRVPGVQFISPKVHMGVNTVGSSHRNGSLDIRGDIPNPKFTTGIWNQSTIDPDTNIRGICNSI